MRQKVLQARRAVDLRRLVDVGRQRLQAAEHDQRDIRRPLPGVDEGDGRDHPLRRGQPVRARQPDLGQQVVGGAYRRVQHHQPHHADHHRRQHERRDHQGADDAGQLFRRMQQDRDIGAEHQLQPERQQVQDQGDLQAVPELGVLEHLDVVVAVVQGRGAAEAEFVQAHPDRVGERERDQRDREHDRGRRQERELVTGADGLAHGQEYRQHRAGRAPHAGSRPWAAVRRACAPPPVGRWMAGDAGAGHPPAAAARERVESAQVPSLATSASSCLSASAQACATGFWPSSRSSTAWPMNSREAGLATIG